MADRKNPPTLGFLTSQSRAADTQSGRASRALATAATASGVLAIAASSAAARRPRCGAGAGVLAAGTGRGCELIMMTPSMAGGEETDTGDRIPQVLSGA